MQETASTPVTTPDTAARATSPPGSLPAGRTVPQPYLPAEPMPKPARAAARPAAPRRRAVTRRRLRLGTVRPAWTGLLAWVVAWLGTALLADEGQRAWGLALLLAGGGLALLAWGRVRPRPGFGPRVAAGPLPRRLLALAGWGAAGLAAWQAGLAYAGHRYETFGLAGWLWLLSMGLAVTAALVWPRPPAAPASAATPAPTGISRRTEVLVFAGLLVLAVAVRTWDLQGVPFAVHGDEILTGRTALQGYAAGRSAPIFGTLWDDINLPALWFVLVAASLKVGGLTLAALRLPAALFGAATVIPFYGLVRLAWGRAAAIAGTAILAVSASQVHYSRVTLNNIVTPFFWTVCFYFVLRGLRTRRPLPWVLAGLAGGLSEYSYYGTRLLPFLLLAFGSYLLVVHWREGWRFLGHFALVALGYVAGFGPLLAYYLLTPGMYFGRSAENGALMWNHMPRDWADLQLMWATLAPLLAENLLGISTHADTSTVYWAPLLLPAEAALLVLGVVLLIRQWRHPAAFLTLLWGAGVLFVGGTLIHGVPFLAHWTPGFPAFYVALAVPVGLWANSAGLRQGGFARHRWAALRWVTWPRLLVAGLLGALALVNVNFYFNQHQVTRPEFELRAAQTRWAAALGTDYRVRSVGRTWQPYDTEMIQYMVHGQDGGVIWNPAAELPLPGAPGKGLAFVFFPDNDQYGSAVQAIYPGGTRQEVASHVPGVHLLNTYTLTAAQTASLYGVHLDLAAADGGAYHWSGRVAQFGALPPEAAGRLAARWSAGVYLPAAGTYLLDVRPPAAHVWLDGQPAPAAAAFLPSGWHRVVVEATISAPSAPRLLLSAGSEGAEVPTERLWPVAAGSGLLGAVGSPNGAVPRVDPFVGYSAVGEPIVSGPGQVAPGAPRVRWTGSLQVSTPGAYVLEVRTDGAARLAIDGQDVSATCAAAETTSAPVTLQLDAGSHPLVLDYAAGPGRLIVELYWTPPGGERVLIPPAALRYAADDALASATLPVPPTNVDCTPTAAQLQPANAAPGALLPAHILGVEAGFKEPRGVAVDAQGQVFVGDSGNSRVVRLDPAGKVVGAWGGETKESAAGKFGLLADVAVTPDGHIVTLDVAPGDIQVFAADGTVLLHLPGVAPNASGIAVGPDGRIWVAHTGASRVLRFSAQGVLDGNFTGAAPGHPGFEQPIDVAVAPDGTAYVIDLHGRIVRLAADGSIAAEWPVEWSGARGGSHLAVWQGLVVMTDPERHRLTILDPASGVTRTVGGAGSAPGQFLLPLGIAAGPDGALYVTDSDNARVQVFTDLGK
ncbi:MAG TPA: glycosyltransferase family 39 protein [Chloroflexia bacterium]|nr:glycosyltransferase family 39 protein [Chloroflexia bacterium]